MLQTDVKIALASEDDMISINLIDNGPGFPEMDLGKLLGLMSQHEKREPALVLPSLAKSWRTTK